MNFLAVGNNELGENLGSRIKCKRCGKNHAVRYGEEKLSNGKLVPSKALAFVKCGKHVCLVGINERSIR